MAENDDAPVSPSEDVTPTETIETTGESPAPAAPVATPVANPVATRFRDTLWTFKAVVAVALATFLIGGIGGALIVAATNGHDDRPGRMMRIGPGDFGRGHGFGKGPRDFRGPDGQGRGWSFEPGPPGANPSIPGPAPGPGSSSATPSAPRSGSTG